LEYQQRYRRRRMLLLKQRAGLGVASSEEVSTTCSLSFEQVEQKSPLASDLLRLCAFLHPDAIPLELMMKGAIHPDPIRAAGTYDDVAPDHSIAMLEGYALVRRDASEETLSVHWLVQAVLKDTMDEKERKQWAERAVQVVNVVFPEVSFET